MKSVIEAGEAAAARLQAAISGEGGEWAETQDLLPALAGTLMDKEDVERVLEAGAQAILMGASHLHGDPRGLRAIMESALLVTLLTGYEAGASMVDEDL